MKKTVDTRFDYGRFDCQQMEGNKMYKVNFDNETIERLLTGILVERFLEEGYRIQFSDQDGGGLYLYGMPENKPFPKSDDSKINHWVRLIPGNGVDFITDYSTNLESILKPINEYINTIN